MGTERFRRGFSWILDRSVKGLKSAEPDGSTGGLFGRLGFLLQAGLDKAEKERGGLLHA
jgi:hypothetical protein